MIWVEKESKIETLTDFQGRPMEVLVRYFTLVNDEMPSPGRKYVESGEVRQKLLTTENTKGHEEK